MTKQAKVIGVVQLKGGTGRSTIAVNLAGGLSEKNKVTLVDCDLPQASSASWFAIRESKTENLLLETARSFDEVSAAIKKHGSTGYIILDAPPRVEELTRSILVTSDLVIIPISASVFDLWAIDDLLKTIEASKSIKPDLKVRLLWNRFRGYTSSASELSESAKALNLRELRTRLGFRVAYPDSVSRGRTVLEWKDKQARSEMKDLVKEVIKLVR